MAKKNKKASGASSKGEELQSETSQTSVVSEQNQNLSLEEALKAAQEECRMLKHTLALRDAELAALKSGAKAAPATEARNEELIQLQDKLRQLRKEQQEADAAKDAAWRQLKGVIGEISKMAAPAPSGPPTSLGPTTGGVTLGPA